MLRIHPTALAHIRAHAEEAYPHESCGVLLGTHTPPNSTSQGWLVRVAVRAANIRTDSPQNRYEIAPAEPSATDLAEAHWLQCSYVITEVAHGRAARTASFLLAGTTEDDKCFEPEPIELLPPA